MSCGRWRRAWPKSDSAAEFPLFVRERVTLPAHLAALDGRWAEACSLYASALNDETGIDLYGQAMETRVRYAHALVMERRIAEAAAALGPVFERVRSSGEIGGALVRRPARAWAVLASTAWGAHLPAQAAQMLADWAQRLRAARASQASAPAATAAVAANRADALSVLSTRERDVLARIADGDSNKLIARAFDLSPHTVKRHVANILDKLGVQSRGQAAARWRKESPR